MKNFKALLILLACVLALGLIIASCEDSISFADPDGNNPGSTNPGTTNPGNPDKNPGSTIAVTGVSLNKSSISLNMGDSETLTAAITPSNATNKNVIWQTSNSAVAIVSTYGTVVAISAGTTTITVTSVDGSKKANCIVTVTFFGGGTPTPVPNGTEAYITVTGLSSKIGKYLDVQVCRPGDISSGKWTPILYAGRSHPLINNSSMTIHLGSNSGSIDPNGTYDINLMIFDNPNDWSTSDHTTFFNVRLVSARANVSYTQR